MWLHHSAVAKVNMNLMEIGPEARKVFKTQNLTADEKKDIKNAIEQFDIYCENVPNYERYRFNLRQQGPGKSFDRYVTALCHMTDKCGFDAITPDGILIGRIIFCIADNKVRERLLRKPDLNLNKTLNICRAVLEEEEDYPVLQVFRVSTSQTADSSLVTLKMANGNFLWFEIDNWA